MSISVGEYITIGLVFISALSQYLYFKAKVETKLKSIDQRLDKQNNRIEKNEDRLIKHLEHK